MGRLLGALTIVALLGAAFAGLAWADETGASDGMREMIREEIEAYQKDQKHDFRVYWKNGLNMKSGDGNFTLKIGGRIQADFLFFDDYDKNLEEAVDGEWHSGFEFRRARLYMAGDDLQVRRLQGAVRLRRRRRRLQGRVDRASNRQDCLGCMFPDITVGHFKEYFSLEELTSSKYITFMERSLPVSTFAPSRNSGLGLFRDLYGERITVGLGVFGQLGRLRRSTTGPTATTSRAA